MFMFMTFLLLFFIASSSIKKKNYAFKMRVCLNYEYEVKLLVA